MMSEENKQEYAPLTYKQIKVKEILLMPIVPDKHLQSGEMSINNGIIHSGQSYIYDDGSISCPDADMSDFAIMFYGIVYRITVLNTENKVLDMNFAGDTMNSYNTVANHIDKKIKESDEIERKKLNSLKEEWKKRYHCLANFWLIPYSIGRTSKKWSNSDSLDLFLNAVKTGDKIKKRMDNYRGYFLNDKFLCNTENFCYGKFLDIHYLRGYKPFLYKSITYKEKPDEIIKKMIECIELRADNIVRDSKTDEEGKTVCDRLYDFFKENNLM